MFTPSLNVKCLDASPIGCNRLTGWTAASTNNFADLCKVDVAGLSTETIGTNQWLGQRYVSNSVSGVKSTPSVSGSNFTANSFQLAIGSNSLIAAIGDAAGNVGYATNVVINQIVTNGAYLYSAAGCVTSIIYSGASFTNTTDLNWNSQYQLTELMTNGVSAERNGFDALGRRVWTWDGSQTNYLVYDGIQVLADVNSTGGLVRSYVWGPGIDNLLAFTTYTVATAKTYFCLIDVQGTVHALADETGTIVESYRFDAWGRVLGVYNESGQPLTESAVGNRYLWQGREYSWKTGLYYFRSRWYDPITGRWLSNDPIGISGGLNQYVFCSNNPVNYIDPDGLDAQTICLPFGFSFSFHTPFTKHNPGEEAHEAQHRKDWANDQAMPGPEMERRAFAAQAAAIRKLIAIKKAKKSQSECQSAEEKEELRQLELDLQTCDILSRSSVGPGAAGYYKDTHKWWWQKWQK